MRRFALGGLRLAFGLGIAALATAVEPTREHPRRDTAEETAQLRAALAA